LIHIFFFWNSYFLSFQGSLNFGESDVKIHFWSMYGACENLYEFRVTDDIIYQYYPSSQLFKSELCNRYPNMLLRSMVTIWKFKRLNLQLYCHLKKHTTYVVLVLSINLLSFTIIMLPKAALMVEVWISYVLMHFKMFNNMAANRK
jgi:hypothetical protein